MAIEQFANNASTVLSAAINNSTTTITVSAYSTFPSSAQFRILINSEIMIVTGGAGTATWTVTRGAEGTTAAAHDAGATVKHVLTKGAINQFRQDNATYSAFANLPSNANGFAGMSYFPTDSCLVPVHDGSQWRYFGPRFGPFTPPLTTFTNWFNQTTRGSVSTAGGVLTFNDAGPATNGEWLIGRYDACPGTPWTLTLVFIPNWGSTGQTNMGIMLQDGATNHFKGYAVSNNGINLDCWNWADFNVFNNNIYDSSRFYTGRNIVMLRIVNSGTVLTFQTSQDYMTWVTHFTENVSGNYVANINRGGYYMNNLSGTTGMLCSMTVLHCAFT